MERELKQLREVHAIQGRAGCWDIDDYMLGMFNGLELALSIMENRAPMYRKNWVGLTDAEVLEWRNRYKFSRALLAEVEAKLKEKNT